MSSRGRRAQCRDSLGRALRDACHDYHPRVLRPRIRSARRRSLLVGALATVAASLGASAIVASPGAAAAEPNVAVIVVPALTVAEYADRGAIGLFVPGAGSTISRGEGSRLARPRAGDLLSGRARRRPCPAPGGAAGPDDDLSRAAAARLPSQRGALPRCDRRSRVSRSPAFELDPDRRPRLSRRYCADGQGDRAREGAADPCDRGRERGCDPRSPRHPTRPCPRREDGGDARPGRLARPLRRVRSARPLSARRAGRRARRPGCARHGSEPSRRRRRGP